MIVREFVKVGVSSFLVSKQQGFSIFIREIVEFDVFRSILNKNRAVWNPMPALNYLAYGHGSIRRRL